MGNSGDPGTFDLDNLRCSLYHSANYTSSIVAITGITDDRLKRSLRSGKVVVTFRKEAAQIDCQPVAGTRERKDMPMPLTAITESGRDFGCLIRTAKGTCMKCIGDQYLDLRTYQCVD